MLTRSLSEIRDGIKFLLGSAQARKTEQGCLVCAIALEKLDKSHTDQDISIVLSKFNGAYVGIEAHGHLTDEEFVVVKRLRHIENNGSV